jgi:translation initiation factor 2 beta subunit (eIF-2beta)/eIF-5
MDEKENRYTISGVHEYGTLQKALEKFIDKFVLCPICDNPETELVCLLLNIRLEMIDTVMCVLNFCILKSEIILSKENL